MTEEKEPAEKSRGQIIRSGDHGGVIITREAVEGMLEQLEESPKPVYIEHDPTARPVGRMRNGRLIEVAGGEVALETELELFEDTVTAVMKPVGELREEIAALPPWPTEDGLLEITTDARSYSAADAEALREIAAAAGEAEASDNAMRFSELPDPLLIIGLGSAATAARWFFKGFFTKAGEGLGEEVGKDLAEAYRKFKKQSGEMVSRRRPADRPPITLITFDIGRPGGGSVEIEGSSRAVGAELGRFFDADSQLLPIATVYLRAAPEPGRVAKMHFAYAGSGWDYVYGLDDQALPLLIVALSDSDYAEALARAESEATSKEGGGGAEA